MLSFEGDREFSKSPAEVSDRLGDASFLVQGIPGAVTVTRAEPDIAVFSLRPGVSFMRGNLEVTLQVTERIPGKTLRYYVHSKSIGSHNAVEATLAIEARATGSSVHWRVEVTELAGLLKAVPQGLLKAAAQKVIGDVWDALAAKLDESKM